MKTSELRLCSTLSQVLSSIAFACSIFGVRKAPFQASLVVLGVFDPASFLGMDESLNTLSNLD